MINRKTRKHNPRKHQSRRRRVRKGTSKVARSRHAMQRARGLDERLVRRATNSIFGNLLHHKQVLSIALVALGVIYTAKMTVHAIGGAIAKARGVGCAKRGIKQVDRFMSNDKINLVDMRSGLVKAVIGTRKHIDVSMDWTDFDRDDQTTLAISLIMRHGRANPLVWLTARKSELKDRQTLYERTAVQMLREALPEDVRVTLLADRGFGNTLFFDHLRDLSGIDFIIRFRQCILLECDGFKGKAADAVYKNGRVRTFRNARLTAERKGPYTVVLYRARDMKDSWCLATNIENARGMDVVCRYGRRFECEEGFRDLKDWRFGLAFKYTRIKDDTRRERLIFAFALAAFLLTLVGIVSERQRCDRLLRANTSERRTHSLFRQGREIVTGALPPDLERRCLNAMQRVLTLALNKGFCHAMS